MFAFFTSSREWLFSIIFLNLFYCHIFHCNLCYTFVYMLLTVFMIKLLIVIQTLTSIDHNYLVLFNCYVDMLAWTLIPLLSTKKKLYFRLFALLNEAKQKRKKKRNKEKRKIQKLEFLENRRAQSIQFTEVNISALCLC